MSLLVNLICALAIFLIGDITTIKLTDSYSVSSKQQTGSKSVCPCSTTEIPTVSYCNLLQNSDLYNGKLIRIKATYTTYFELSAIYDAACNDNPPFLWTWVDFNGSYKSCSKKEVVESFKNHMFRRDEYGRDIESKAEVTLVGLFQISPSYTFENNFPKGGYGHMNMYKYRIEIKSIEEITPLQK